MHGPSTEWKKDNSTSIKELLGKWLFMLYTLVYGGFILINVLSPDFMGIQVGSMNVAILYGFLLIIFAIFLAFVYNNVSSHAEEVMNIDEAMNTEDAVNTEAGEGEAEQAKQEGKQV